jgi:nucleotide sugar dehydrogenase
MSETTIGIVGQGFVGSAIREGLNNYYKVLTYDIDSSKCNSTHEEVCKESNIIFVCIPTPMKKSGECDTRLLENVVDGITKECAVNSNANKPILVLKSTIPPGTTKRINKNTNLQVCFSPEFLTEANSFEDFKNQNRIIVGGDPAINCDDAKKIKTMFRKPFPNIPIVVTKSETAEMVKYFVNCFLATKVSFSNELYQICEESGLDFNKVVEYALYDQRIGKSHFSVPGPDGSFGFGGHCFPKDLNAIMYMAESCGVDPKVLKSVWDKNNEVRPQAQRDWEGMKGRAVSED